MSDARRPTVQSATHTGGGLDRTARTIMASPVAKVFAFNGCWICPMCSGVFGAITSSQSNWMERAIIHLKTDCPSIRSGERIPKVAPEVMKKNALPQAVRISYAATPYWKCRDHIGNWYCPYCLGGGIRVSGSSPFAAQEIESIIDHILRCASFANGSGKPKTQAQIKQAIDQSNARLERQVRLILSNPASKIFSFDTFWICPMCVEIQPGITADLVNWVEMAAQHLRHACEPVKEGQLAPKLPPYQMKKNVLEQGLRYAIPSMPLYRFRDQSGRWYCPYCTHNAVKVSPADAPLTPADIEVIAHHVQHCFYFDGGRGVAKPIALLEDLVRQANTKLDASQDLRGRLRDDPVWRVRDRNGCWVCPYCRKPVLAVSFQPLRAEDAVDDVSQHLLKHCDGYRRKVQPARDVSELTVLEEKTQVVARTVADEKTEMIQVDRKIYEMMVRMAKDHVISKSDTQSEMEGMLVSAQKTQMKMLPKAPHLPGFEIDVLYRPSQQLSGDFYDFIQNADGTTGFLIADVSGHGIDAALVMGMAKKVISMAGRMQSDPKGVLTYSNEVIRPDLDRGTFITACYGVLHADQRLFRFASAGHNPVLLYNPVRGDLPVAMRPAGIALGIADGAQMESTLEQMEFTLLPGDIVLQYTDGVVEQTNPAGEMLQIEGLMEILRANADRDIRHLLNAVDDALTRFRGAKPQEDDVTVVCFRVQ